MALITMGTHLALVRPCKHAAQAIVALHARLTNTPLLLVLLQAYRG